MGGRRPSSIDRLPTAARKAVNKWLRDPGIPQQEITERTNALLEEMGLDLRVTKSSLNRYSMRERASKLPNHVDIAELNDRSVLILLLRQQIRLLSSFVEQLERNNEEDPDEAAQA